MRITGGVARGIGLSSLKNRALRPASDKIREGLFSSLGDIIKNKRCLDLYAGTGSYGLEALSRGASYCCFIESNRPTFERIKVNYEKVSKSAGLTKNSAQFFHVDALRFLKRSQDRFDIIFIDPPYNLIEIIGKELLENSVEKLNKNGWIIFEMPTKVNLKISKTLCLLKKISGNKKDSPSIAIYNKNSDSVE